MLSPIWNLYPYTGAVAPLVAISQHAIVVHLRRQVKIKADPALCLPCASKVEVLIVHILDAVFVL